MKIKYDKPGEILVTDGPLTVSSDKIFKISDAGTDDIANVTIDKIIRTN